MDRVVMVEQINEILEIKDSYQAPEVLLNILYSGKEKREDVFMKFLQLWGNDVSRDRFHEYFEQEHADRKVKKQDYTPTSIAKLLSLLTGNDGHTIYDPCSGTGGLVISKWWNICLKEGIANYKPSQYLFYCEDLSDRAIPFLLFNLCIRGMNAVVVHCDVLTREAYGVFLIQNVDDDFLHFSNFNVMPQSKDVEQYFNIKFVEKKYKEHIENKNVWLKEN